ncbi:DNA-binding LacI/PurR family transcriptional regulator [Motilibacter peucedani]|uniref:DNA-binding LacI/PurR family transcriptional regulator n=1 Tax=Motilibacter peucedani TaxID=598650 RepID=A0A420XMY7_9ACTN|nr:LacI family DNA-binding transcriptional regulator [Motilibacter peucedani]RKS72644.1 DNA-binding LacI/PurR family transcriptional regulator [Motilibacter peucedani]
MADRFPDDASASARPTLESVARHAGVSRQTVSNVLHAPDRVSPDTAERVQQAVAELGYRPVRAAQQLRTGRSRVLGLRIDPQGGDGVSGAVLDRFLHALTERAQADGYRVMLFAAEDDAGEIAAYDDLLGTLDIDGFLLTSTHYGDVRTAWLRERGVPFVTFGRPWGAEEDHAWVDVDGAAGTSAAVAHLVAEGHERLGFLGWPAGSGVGDDRLRGWRAGLAAAGLTEGPVLAAYAEEERLRAAELLDEGEVTGVVCASDSLAVALRAAAEERGLVLGRDLAVVGFDDSSAASVLGLSSVAQPVREVAAECVRLLRRAIEEGPRPSAADRVLLEPHLVPRASSVKHD